MLIFQVVLLTNFPLLTCVDNYLCSFCQIIMTSSAGNLCYAENVVNNPDPLAR